MVSNGVFQILCLAEMVNFTENCEQGIGNRNLESVLQELQQQLESYTSVDISGDSDTDANVLDLKLKALILDTIHNIEVVELLIEKNVKSKDEWLWQKQLR